VVKIQSKPRAAHDRPSLSLRRAARDVSNPESSYCAAERAKLSKRAIIEALSLTSDAGVRFSEKFLQITCPDRKDETLLCGN
jgi:hypothetical protein